MYVTMTISKYTAYTNSKNYTRIVPRSSFCPISPVSSGFDCDFLVPVTRVVSLGWTFHMLPKQAIQIQQLFFYKTESAADPSHELLLL